VRGEEGNTRRKKKPILDGDKSSEKKGWGPKQKKNAKRHKETRGKRIKGESGGGHDPSSSAWKKKRKKKVRKEKRKKRHAPASEGKGRKNNGRRGGEREGERFFRGKKNHSPNKE